MRTVVCAALLSFAAPVLAAPALAADDNFAGPPSPPPVIYAVWGFRWDGQRYAKQAKYDLSTPDIKQAQAYATQVTSYAGWLATTNMPKACVVHTVYRGPVIAGMPAFGFPAKPTYSVWAYRRADGKWVKDEQHSWMTTNPSKGLEYAKKVNAASGWCATTNCPPVVPQAQRFVEGGMVHGADRYQNLPMQACDVKFGPDARATFPGSISISLGRYGNWIVQLNGIGVYSSTQGSTDNSYVAPTYDSTSDIQNMVSTQDMINNQQMQNNIQDMINTQN
ncbi:MAG TPA: hypothetical protein VGM05_17965, partial [Planctomycetaceae bacterium]